MKKNISLLFVLFLIFILALSGCGAPADTEDTSDTDEKAGYTSLSVAEVKEMLDSDYESDIVLVDVRRVDEYEESHIPGAINIPNEQIETQEPEELSDTDALTVLYCRTGVRSVEAAEKLALIGYTNIINMEGGITEWTYDTVTGAEPGEYVHPVEDISQTAISSDAGVCGTAKKAEQKAAAQE